MAAVGSSREAVQYPRDQSDAILVHDFGKAIQPFLSSDNPEYQKAIECATRALEKFPQEHRENLEQAINTLKKPKHQKAITHARSILDMFAENSQHQEMLKYTEEVLRRPEYQEALQCATEFLEGVFKASRQKKAIQDAEKVLGKIAKDSEDRKGLEFAAEFLKRIWKESGYEKVLQCATEILKEFSTYPDPLTPKTRVERIVNGLSKDAKDLVLVQYAANTLKGLSESLQHQKMIESAMGILKDLSKDPKGDKALERTQRYLAGLSMDPEHKRAIDYIAKFLEGIPKDPEDKALQFAADVLKEIQRCYTIPVGLDHYRNTEAAIDTALGEGLKELSFKTDLTVQQKTVFELQECPGWVIKRALLWNTHTIREASAVDVLSEETGKVTRVIETGWCTTYFANSLRPLVGGFWQEKAEATGLKGKVYVPPQFLIPLPIKNAPEFLQFVAIAPKLEFYAQDKMIQMIQERSLLWQMAMIGYLCDLIRKFGIMDAQFGNIVGLKNRSVRYFDDDPFPCIALIDTEGDAFAMVVKELSSVLESRPMPGKERKILSLAAAALIGLKRFERELRGSGFLEDVMRVVAEKIVEAEKEVSDDKRDIASEILEKGPREKSLWETFRSTRGKRSAASREEKKEE